MGIIFGSAIILLYYAIGIAGLSVALRKTKKNPRATQIISCVAIVAFLGPWLDEIWISYQFETACEDAGIHVTRQVVVDGYYDGTGSGPTKEGFIESPQSIEAYEESGFKFREFHLGYRMPGKISRVERIENDRWLLTIHDKPTARFHLINTHDHTKIGYQMVKHEEIILDTDKNEVIGREASYSRYPGFVIRLWIGAYGSGQRICNQPVGTPKSQYSGSLLKQAFKASDREM